MTISELLAILSLYTGLLTAVSVFMSKSGKLRMDNQEKEIKALAREIDHAHHEIRHEHNTLAHLIARDYMDKTNTMEMYSLMSQATEEKVDAVYKKVDTMNNKLDQVLLLMAEKNK